MSSVREISQLATFYTAHGIDSASMARAQLSFYASNQRRRHLFPFSTEFSPFKVHVQENQEFKQGQVFNS